MTPVRTAVRSCRRSASPLLRGFAVPPFRGPMLVALAALAAGEMVDLHTVLPALCGDRLSWGSVVAGSGFALAVTPPSHVAFAWLAMVAAMMTPLVVSPLAHVRAATLVSRRVRASAGFLLGYFGVWMLAGAPILLAALVLRLAIGGVAATLAGAVLLALAWSASPLHQAAQNRAHRLRPIGLFGMAADRDCVAYGARVGLWCTVSCWPWMAVPLFVPAGHVLAMVAIAAIVLAERMRGPGPLRWRAPVPLAAVVRWATAAREAATRKPAARA